MTEDHIQQYHRDAKSKTQTQKILQDSPDWCSSAGWASPHKAKGHWLDSRSGHRPELWAQSPVGGVREANDRCFSPFLSPFFSFFLRINKIFKKKRKKRKFYRTNDQFFNKQTSRKKKGLHQPRQCVNLLSFLI